MVVLRSVAASLPQFSETDLQLPAVELVDSLFSGVEVGFADADSISAGVDVLSLGSVSPFVSSNILPLRELKILFRAVQGGDMVPGQKEPTTGSIKGNVFSKTPFALLSIEKD